MRERGDGDRLMPVGPMGVSLYDAIAPPPAFTTNAAESGWERGIIGSRRLGETKHDEETS